MGPIGLIYKDSSLLFPDHFIDGRIKPSNILFLPHHGAELQWLKPISEAEFKSASAREEANVTKVNVKTK